MSKQGRKFGLKTIKLIDGQKESGLETVDTGWQLLILVAVTIIDVVIVVAMWP